MKKLVTLFTLAIAMVASADVASQNIVGFNTINLPVGQYTSLGWQFGLIGGNTAVQIASLTNYPSAKTGLNFGVADAIRVFNSATSTWTDYFRSSTGWKKVGESTLTTDTISVGQMVMFMKRTTASAITQSGEVIDTSIQLSLPVGQYTAMCNPYPAAISITNLTNYTNAKTGLNFGVADAIRVFNSATSTWTDYFRSSTGWKKVGESTLTTNAIPAGVGFMFMKRTTAGVITFTSPISSN